MSGIANIGTNNSNSSLYLLMLQQSNGADPSTNADASIPTTSASTDSNTGNSTSDGPGNPNLADLRSQIETAVTNAINGLGDSSSPTDLLQAVHDAIQGTLKANGINPAQLRGHGHHRHHHHHNADETQNAAAAGGATTDPDGDGGADNSSNPNLTTSSLLQEQLTILQLLGGQNGQASGATSPGTSGQPSGAGSLASIINSSGAGQGVDLSTLFGQLFASFPNGSGVNLQA